VNGASLEQILRESSFLRNSYEDPALQAICNAILIEDALGVVLYDEQLASGDLQNLTRVRALLSESAHPG
jgi:hypothetical protein